jgi:hypothetical protein
MPIKSPVIDSRLQVDQLLAIIGDAARQSHSSPLVEDYVVFHVEGFTERIDLKLFCAEYATQIAQILRAERQPLSDQEIEDALAVRISYSMNDMLLVDWSLQFAEHLRESLPSGLKSTHGMLEWIIIVLIAFSIAVGFIH